MGYKGSIYEKNEMRMGTFMLLSLLLRKESKSESERERD